MKLERFTRGLAVIALGIGATSVNVPTAHASLSIPKGAFQACSVAPGDYCIESVSLTPVGGKAIALSWVATGGAGATAGNTNNVAAGKELPGRWSAPDAFATENYDGLYLEAQNANEFVPWIVIDAKPTYSPGNRVSLAALPTSATTSVNLNSEVAITLKMRISDFQVGVTFGVVTDATVNVTTADGKNVFEFSGYPVKVPTAKSSKDCTGDKGVASTVVTQFQSVIVPSNDPMGFTIPGSAGKIYVGSNGICKLSTPVWNADKKAFSYKASAPRLAPDGTTVNTGFYYASISYADAIALWNLTRPEDAATALVVSVRTGAGGSTAATANVSAKNGKIVIQVSGFEFPDPMLDISLNPAYNDLGKPSADSNMTVAASEQQMSTPKKSTAATSKGSVAKVKTTTISCVKGKTTKKVTAAKPVCPAGFKKI
ncbi:MAG: hypothetical protein F2530_04415 [Actinobacteria bacterium]|uniref:Unannotated protein n=1 Tax=freshwater metagenome TaxID=449393 RepID=A0A6J6C6W6_9ZZZZ|nr:hypothetical protein [Actinomycetota bacterium]